MLLEINKRDSLGELLSGLNLTRIVSSNWYFRKKKRLKLQKVAQISFRLTKEP